MFLKKLQCPIPSVLRRLWMIALWVRVIVKSVRGARIDFILERLSLLLHRLFKLGHLRGNSLILLAVVTQNRTCNVFDIVQVFGTPAIINHGGRDIFVARGNEQDVSSSPAKAR